MSEKKITTDPWAHRATFMRCISCMYFAPKKNIGRCRRHAPTMQGFPVMFTNDWCGDHKLNEDYSSPCEPPEPPDYNPKDV